MLFLSNQNSAKTTNVVMRCWMDACMYRPITDVKLCRPMCNGGVTDVVLLRQKASWTNLRPCLGSNTRPLTAKRNHYQLRPKNSSCILTRVVFYIPEEWVSPIHTGYIWVKYFILNSLPHHHRGRNRGSVMTQEEQQCQLWPMSKHNSWTACPSQSRIGQSK